MDLKYTELINQALTLEGSIGNTYSRFYNYSVGNQFFFMLQGISEPVASFNVWKKLGRYPKKNTAKMVIAPVPLYDKETKEQDGCYFKIKKGVFAYSDTYGEDITIPEVTAIDWKISRAEEALKINKVAYESVNGNSQGYSFDQSYAINPVAVYPLKTTMHELAHIVLGHTKTGEKSNHERSTAEFQAEATAYILMNEMQSEDWNKGESRSYIQNWLQDQKPSDKDIKAVFTAVNKILNAGKAEA